VRKKELGKGWDGCRERIGHEEKEGMHWKLHLVLIDVVPHKCPCLGKRGGGLTWMMTSSRFLVMDPKAP
jgi:hypothetical protein